MGTLLGYVSSFVAVITSVISSFANVIMNTPILLIGIVIAISGAGVGFLQRLMRTN